MIVAQLHGNTRDALDALEYRIYGTIAHGRILVNPAILVPQADGRGRDAAGDRLKGLERPRGRTAMDFGFRKRLDVRIVDFFFAVGQLLELVEHVLKLFFIQVVAQVYDPLAERVPTAVLAQHQI